MNAMTNPHSIDSVALASVADAAIVAAARAVSADAGHFTIESPVGGKVGEFTVSAPEVVQADSVPEAVVQPTMPASATIDRASLSAAVSAAVRAVERRSTIPILAAVHIVGDSTGITVTGTDMDLTITARAIGSADDGFCVIMPAHALADILKKTKAAMVTITSTEWFANMHGKMCSGTPHVVLDFDGNKVTMQGFHRNDFPSTWWPTLTRVSYSMPSADLRRLISKTEFAISTEETRYYLNGMFLESIHVDGRGFLRGVATDGHRMALCDVPLPSGCPDVLASTNIIIPRRSTVELHRILKTKGAAPVVDVTLSADRYEVVVGGITLHTKTVDGTFPPYARVIPMGNENIATIDRTALRDAIASVAAIASERGRACKFTFSRDEVVLTVNNPDSGTARSTVPCQFALLDPETKEVRDDVLSIGFNVSYVLTALDYLEGDTVTIAMNDSGSPALLRDVGATDYLTVLMPMRV